MGNSDYTEKQDVLDRVLTLVLQGKNSCLYGIEGSGKSLLLQELELPKKYVQVNYSGNDIVEFAKNLLKAFSGLKLPNVIKDVKKRALGGDVDAALKLPDMLAVESKKKIVLVLEDCEFAVSDVRGNNVVLVIVSDHRVEDVVSVRYCPKVIPVYEEIKKSDSSSWIFDLLFKEKLNRLSSKEKLILESMIRWGLHTPAEVSEKIDYVSTSVRRFMALMEEKGFLELRSRGYFEIMDKELEKWLKKRVRK